MGFAVESWAHSFLITKNTAHLEVGGRAQKRDQAESCRAGLKDLVLGTVESKAGAVGAGLPERNVLVKCQDQNEELILRNIETESN